MSIFGKLFVYLHDKYCTTGWKPIKKGNTANALHQIKRQIKNKPTHSDVSSVVLFGMYKSGISAKERLQFCPSSSDLSTDNVNIQVSYDKTYLKLFILCPCCFRFHYY